MLFYHPAYYPLALASGAMRIPWLHRRVNPPVIPEGELYVHDILRIIEDHKIEELEQSLMLSPRDDAPDAPTMLNEAQRHRLFRRIVVSVTAFTITVVYGTGILHM